MEGYKFMFNEKLVTVWSAPNYYYRCGNVASIMELDENLQKYFKIFEAAPTDIKHNVGSEVPHYFLWDMISSIWHWCLCDLQKVEKSDILDALSFVFELCLQLLLPLLLLLLIEDAVILSYFFLLLRDTAWVSDSGLLNPANIIIQIPLKLVLNFHGFVELPFYLLLPLRHLFGLVYYV